MRRIILAGWLYLWVSPAFCAPPSALFYMTDGPDSVSSFLAHSGKIDLLVPAWYNVDESGLVTGAPNATVLAAAQSQGLPVMPLLALFGKARFHSLAGNEDAQTRMNDSLLHEAKLHGYVGFQIDFEHIDDLDRDLLTAVVARSADTLHKAGLKLTIATVPNAPGYPGNGGYSKWIFADWRGAYDLAALAKSVDLICLMTYDQHTPLTMPGPVAGWQWTVGNLDYALQFVPKEKLSLGIPLYGYHWHTGAPIIDQTTGDARPNLIGEAIKGSDALQLTTEFAAKPDWDATDHAALFFFYRDQLREWVFYTDQRTFHDRYQLAADRGLEGFCSWRLGQEDPDIWTVLPDRKASH
jgi:spore germination protein YaaH